MEEGGEGRGCYQEGGEGGGATRKALLINRKESFLIFVNRNNNLKLSSRREGL